MTVSPIPLYHLISRDIWRRVEDGDYPEGEAIPTEDVLAAEFGVSRATVRAALSELVNAGFVSRQRGRGTFVIPRPGKKIGQRLHGSLTDLLDETSRTGVHDVEVLNSVPIPVRIADLLELDEPVGTEIRRIRTTDRQPFAYTVNYLPDVYGKMLEADDLRSNSLMALMGKMGVRLVGARQSIRPQLGGLDLTTKLSLPYDGAPVLYVERLVWSEGVKPVEFARTWYREDLYEYTVTFDLETGMTDVAATDID